MSVTSSMWPSTPMGWSAGKWGEWYPDLLQPNGRLGTRRTKPYWQTGWWAQHQRLLEVLSGQRERIPLIISGDLHAIASGAIQRSGTLVLDRPVQTILSGPISSDDVMWPSSARGTEPQVPSGLTVDERMKPLEAQRVHHPGRGRRRDQRAPIRLAQVPAGRHDRYDDANERVPPDEGLGVCEASFDRGRQVLPRRVICTR